MARNSGSLVLDARGRLIGLNFDSNREAVSARWWFEPRYKRAIHVDLRDMRWPMAKVYPAPHLPREMGLPVEWQRGRRRARLGEAFRRAAKL